MQGFVLAGGQSTRMGRDKALLELEGRPLVARAVETLRALGIEVRICGGQQGGPRTVELARYAEVIPDSFAGCGPLGGIEAGLAASDTELNLFLAVDLPAVSPEFLQWMAVRAERSGAVATIPRCGGREQPLCAVYRRPLLDGLQTMMGAGHLKVVTAVREAAGVLGERIDCFDVETVAAALGEGEWPATPPARDWLRNVNTPQDYERMRAGH